MAFRPSKRRHHTSIGQELNLIPVMNVFVIVIPFLLLTAVFAKTAIIDILLPQEDQAQAEENTDEDVPEVLIVKITKKGFELDGIGKGKVVPRIKDRLDYKGLTEELIKLKDKYPDKKEVILLFEPHVSYDTVVKVMDTTRETVDGKRRELFPFVSLGENR